MDSRERLIDAHLPAAFVAVDTFLRRNPGFAYLADDLLGEARLRVVQVVDRFARGEIDYIGGNLWVYLRRGCADVVRRQLGEETSGLDARRFRAVPKALPADAGDAAPGLAEVDARDLGRVCCSDAIDEGILEMLLAGKPKRDIAAAFGLSQPAVWARRKRIGERLRMELAK